MSKVPTLSAPCAVAASGFKDDNVAIFKKNFLYSIIFSLTVLHLKTNFDII